MYGKIHDCIFGSSIMEEDITIRYIWMCFVTAADKHGIVDDTVAALARKFNVNINDLFTAIQFLMKTDASSRHSEAEGRRIVPIRDTYGWKIVNYEYYRDLQTQHDRTEYMKDYMKVYRSKQSVNTVNTRKHLVSTLVDTDVDVDVDVDIDKDLNKSVKKATASSSNEQFIQSLKDNPAYEGINIDTELGKMDSWLSARPGRKKTKKFVVNWLNRVEKPMGGGNGKAKSVVDEWAEEQGVNLYSNDGERTEDIRISIPQIQAHKGNS